jgi:CRISPR/Cas system CSM-associated protein Csm2 small subunit
MTIAAVLLSAMGDFGEQQLTILGEMVAMAFAIELQNASDEKFRSVFQNFETCLEERVAFHRKIVKEAAE